MIYNDPIGGSPSSIGATQMNEYKWIKKALVEARKTARFGQMADVTNMPKHFGKKIKLHHYLPLLDDANMNDQGIDAAGVSTTVEKTIIVSLPDTNSEGNVYLERYAVGEGANSGAATTAAEAAALDIFKEFGVFDTNYATSKSAVEGLTPAWSVDDSNDVVPASGNLYGSSKDIGSITNKMPVLTETGGRVNRVGFTRIEIEGEISKYGFFDEYTKESVDFDSDSELKMHINREMINGAHEIVEDLLMLDLVNAAGVVRFGGEATTAGEISGEADEVSVVTYQDLMRLSIDLDNNRCPKNTTRITGTRMIDTKVVNGARYLFIGSELIPMCRKMVDLFGDQAFVSVEKYAGGGSVAEGEIGQIDQFKIIVVPEMLQWSGVGKTVSTNTGYRETGGKYDVFPALVVGDKSFTTIGFQTDGKTVKFSIKHRAPESEGSYTRDDPYGELGFMSIKWYYGSLILRPERIALIKCAAEW